MTVSFLAYLSIVAEIKRVDLRNLMPRIETLVCGQLGFWVASFATTCLRLLLPIFFLVDARGIGSSSSWCMLADQIFGERLLRLLAFVSFLSSSFWWTLAEPDRLSSLCMLADRNIFFLLDVHVTALLKGSRCPRGG